VHASWTSIRRLLRFRRIGISKIIPDLVVELALGDRISDQVHTPRFIDCDFKLPLLTVVSVTSG
jgi:hypothetical protein